MGRSKCGEREKAVPLHLSLLPQRFNLPPAGKAHQANIHIWIFHKQSLEACRKCVAGINGIEPIGDTAEYGIQLERLLRTI